MFAQRRERDPRAVPRAEVLRGDPSSGEFAEASVELVGRHRRAVDREQAATPLSEEVGDDARDGSVVQRDLCLLAGLGREVEQDRAAGDLHVLLRQRRQAVAGVLLRVLLTADAQSAGVHDAHHRGKHLIAVHRAPAQLSGHLGADLRQPRAEVDQPVEVEQVAKRAPMFVVQVLAPAAVVLADREQVSVLERADPHVCPGRRNREGLQPHAHRPRDGLARRIDVAEPFSAPQPADSRLVRTDVPQPGGVGAALRVVVEVDDLLDRDPLATAGRRLAGCGGLGHACHVPEGRGTRNLSRCADRETADGGALRSAGRTTSRRAAARARP